MLTLELPSLYRKRRHGARDYFLHIPEPRVNLRVMVDGPDYRAHARSYGLDALKCQSVACLAGWLITWPDYRDWLTSRPLKGVTWFNNAQFNHLAEYLGLDQCRDFGPCGGGPTCLNLFASRCIKVDGPLAKHKGISDKIIALRRLDLIVDEADAACGCPS
jgi:hypothetical protein